MISVTILVKNGEVTIRETLDSLTRFDEVVVYDTGSTDGTLKIAKEYSNVKIYKAPFEGFGVSHNKASAKAKHNWILSVDCDEVITKELADEILSLDLDTKSVYKMIRHNYFNGKWIKGCAGWHPDWIVRLYNRKSTTFTNDEVHEKIISDSLKTVSLKHPMRHVPYQQIGDFLSKMQSYSDLFVKQKAGKKKSSLPIALKHAFFAFFKSYILRKGILCGGEGFIISAYNAHTAFYKYLKLAEANRALLAKKELSHD